jgi:hypothetical protein
VIQRNRFRKNQEIPLMAHIRLPEGIPGILGPMAFSPETAKPLNALAEVLLPPARYCHASSFIRGEDGRVNSNRLRV